MNTQTKTMRAFGLCVLCLVLQSSARWVGQRGKHNRNSYYKDWMPNWVKDMEGRDYGMPQWQRKICKKIGSLATGLPGFDHCSEFGTSGASRKLKRQVQVEQEKSNRLSRHLEKELQKEKDHVARCKAKVEAKDRDLAAEKIDKQKEAELRRASNQQVSHLQRTLQHVNLDFQRKTSKLEAELAVQLQDLKEEQVKVREQNEDAAMKTLRQDLDDARAQHRVAALEASQLASQLQEEKYTSEAAHRALEHEQRTSAELFAGLNAEKNRTAFLSSQLGASNASAFGALAAALETERNKTAFLLLQFDSSSLAQQSLYSLERFVVFVAGISSAVFMWQLSAENRNHKTRSATMRDQLTNQDAARAQEVEDAVAEARADCEQEMSRMRDMFANERADYEHKAAASKLELAAEVEKMSRLQAELDAELGGMIKMDELSNDLGSDFTFHIFDEILDKETVRSVKIKCPGVHHCDVNFEIIFNGCIVTIDRKASPGVEAIQWSKKLQFRPSEGLFEFKGDQVFLDCGFLTFVFRAYAFQSRIFRLPTHLDGAWEHPPYDSAAKHCAQSSRLGDAVVPVGLSGAVRVAPAPVTGSIDTDSYEATCALVIEQAVAQEAATKVDALKIQGLALAHLTEVTGADMRRAVPNAGDVCSSRSSSDVSGSMGSWQLAKIEPELSSSPEEPEQ